MMMVADADAADADQVSAGEILQPERPALEHQVSVEVQFHKSSNRTQAVRSQGTCTFLSSALC